MYTFEEVLEEIFRTDPYYDFPVFVEFFRAHFDAFNAYAEEFENIQEYALDVISEFMET